MHEQDYPGGKGGTVWLFDQRDRWRELYRYPLEKAGFSVRQSSNYRYRGQSGGGLPDLAILASTTIGPAELEAVSSLAKDGVRLLVLASTLPSETMRLAFRAGAYDVSLAPGRPDQVVHLVEEALLDAPAVVTAGF